MSVDIINNDIDNNLEELFNLMNDDENVLLREQN